MNSYTLYINLYSSLYRPPPPTCCLSSLCPWSIKALIAFSMWKSLISSGFVRAPWSDGMSDCCGRRIRIRQPSGGREVYLDQLAECDRTASIIGLWQAGIEGRGSHSEAETFPKSLKVRRSRVY